MKHDSKADRGRSAKDSYPPGCPRCHSTDGFHPIVTGDEDTGCLMLIFGGIIPYLIYDSSRHGRIECENCGFIFLPDQLSTKRDYVFLFTVLALIIAIAVFLVLGFRS